MADFVDPYSVVGSIASLPSTGGPSPSAGAHVYYQSSIEKAQEDIQNMDVNLMVPLLIPPWLNQMQADHIFSLGIGGLQSAKSSENDGKKLLDTFSMKVHEIIIAFWNAVVRTQKEIEAQDKKEEAVKREEKRSYERHIENRVRALESGQSESVAGTLALGAIFSGAIPGAVGLHMSQVDLGPVEAAFTQVMRAIPVNLQINAGYVSALAAKGAAGHATMGAVFGPPGQGFSFARQYAYQILSLISNSHFDEYAKMILTQGSAKAGNKDLEQALHGIKLAMLFNTLGLLYKTETGWLTAQEIRDMILGDMDLPKGDIRLVVIQMIRDEKNALARPQRLPLIATLVEYLDNNPDVNHLLSTLDTLKGMFSGGKPPVYTRQM